MQRSVEDLFDEDSDPGEVVGSEPTPRRVRGTRRSASFQARRARTSQIRKFLGFPRNGPSDRLSRRKWPALNSSARPVVLIRHHPPHPSEAELLHPISPLLDLNPWLDPGALSGHSLRLGFLASAGLRRLAVQDDGREPQGGIKICRRRSETEFRYARPRGRLQSVTTSHDLLEGTARPSRKSQFHRITTI